MSACGAYYLTAKMKDENMVLILRDLQWDYWR